MFIKKLSIYSAVKKELLRQIDFRLGVNFIVDSEQSEKHNQVGKTTCLKLIDLSLGAREKSALYEDKETGITNEKLKGIIENDKLYVELILTDNLNKPGKEICIKTDLFSKGRRYVNGEVKSPDELKAFLNELLCQNNNNSPSFRELIKSFVRVLMTRDNEQFLKLGNPYISTLKYRAIYNFLFEISNPDNSISLGKLKKKRTELDRLIKDYIKINEVPKKEEIMDKIRLDKREIKKLDSLMNDIVDANKFKKNRANINEARKKYESLSKELNVINFEISKVSSYFRELEESKKIENNIETEFYYEISQLLPSIVKTFSELVEFNKRLNENKVAYFKERLISLTKEKSRLVEEIGKLTDIYGDFISLIEGNKTDQYFDVVRKLDDLKINNAKYEDMLDKISRLEEKKREIDNCILENEKEISRAQNEYLEKIGIFNTYFEQVAIKINKERPVLRYSTTKDKFPVSIENLLEGTSTGTRKSLIAAYDIAYQLFARHINKKVPNFIVHDVLESIEGENLKSLVEVVESNQIQYISAVLKEKLISSNIQYPKDDSFIILELSMKDRLFEGGEQL